MSTTTKITTKKLLTVGTVGIILFSSMSIVSADFHADGDNHMGEREKNGFSGRFGYGKAGVKQHVEGVKKAVQAGDYSMLSDEAQEKISVDQFAQMQDKRVAAQEMKMKTEEAVKNNDFAAFVAVVEEMRAAKKAMKDDHAGENNDREGHEFSDEKLQKKFEKLTTYYVENGTLPEMKGKGKGGVRMKKFARGKLKSSHKGLVMKAITNSSSDTLERVLEVIEKRVEKMESSDMGEEKKMSVIEMLEGIAQVIVEQLDGDLEDGEFESLLEEVLS